MASIMSQNGNKALEKFEMRYSAAYPTGAERIDFSSSFLEVKVKGEQWNWRFKVSGFDRINGIYRIG